MVLMFCEGMEKTRFFIFRKKKTEGRRQPTEGMKITRIIVRHMTGDLRKRAIVSGYTVTGHRECLYDFPIASSQYEYIRTQHQRKEGKEEK